jgi:hypothetical protein
MNVVTLETGDVEIAEVKFVLRWSRADRVCKSSITGPRD